MINNEKGFSAIVCYVRLKTFARHAKQDWGKTVGQICRSDKSNCKTVLFFLPYSEGEKCVSVILAVSTLAPDLSFEYCPSLRSRREWVPARTSVPNARAKSRAGREKNGEEFACEGISGFAAKSAHPLPPATHANTARVARVRKKCDCYAVNSRPEQNRHS